MITSTHGVKLPEDGDKGTTVFDALNSNFEILRDHIHSGSDSGQIEMTDILKATPTTLAASGWVPSSVASGYEQSVTCPGTVILSNCTMRFRVKSGTHANKFIHPTVVPSSVTQFKVIVNDPTIELEILYI